MNADRLFLERFRQLAELEQSPNEIDLLDIGAILRQLLADSHSLVGTVNAASKLKLVFRVSDFSYAPDEFTALLVLEDGLDLEASFPGKPTRELKLDQFLRHVVIHTPGAQHAILDVIRTAANVSGGVHHDPKGAARGLAAFGQQLNLRDTRSDFGN
jgi:hypothetical protein